MISSLSLPGRYHQTLEVKKKTMNSQMLSIKIIYFLVLIFFTCCSTGNQESTQIQNLNQESIENFRVDKKYSYSDINDFDSADFRIKRNEIFAQYGYKFKSQELTEYFKKFRWYTPKTDNVDSLLTDLDIKNIKFLKKHERILKYERKRKHSIIDNLAVDYPLSEFNFIYKLENNHQLLMDTQLLLELDDWYLGKYLYPNIVELRETEYSIDADERYPLQVVMTRPVQLSKNHYLFSSVSFHHGANYTDFLVFYSLNHNAIIMDTIKLDPFKYRGSDLFLIRKDKVTNLRFETDDEILKINLDSTGKFSR